MYVCACKTILAENSENNDAVRIRLCIHNIGTHIIILYCNNDIICTSIAPEDVKKKKKKRIISRVVLVVRFSNRFLFFEFFCLSVGCIPVQLYTHRIVT